MKKYILAVTCSILVFAALSLAQSVVITPKKTTYRRQKPIVDFKKTFTVTRPVVKASTPALSKKIAAAISYEKVSDLNIKDEMNDVQWLEEAEYKVNYNKNGILDITLIVTGTGAYPSTFQKTVVINTKTGLRVMPKDVFADLAGLAAKGKKAQQIEIKQGLADIKKEEPDAESPENLFENADFKIENLDEFSVGDRGVTFIYDYGFPHVIQAMQPDGRYFFSWKEIKRYVKPAGLFGIFVR